MTLISFIEYTLGGRFEDYVDRSFFYMICLPNLKDKCKVEKQQYTLANVLNVNSSEEKISEAIGWSALGKELSPYPPYVGFTEIDMA